MPSAIEIEAGIYFFLSSPHRFEPCEINQITTCVTAHYLWFGR